MNSKEAYEYITETVSWIKKNCIDVDHVGFSGGKDSICLAQLMKIAQVSHKLHYQYTGIDPPEILHFVRRYYPECKIHFPKRTFWRELSISIPPGHIRWCCRLLKKTKGDSILGIRKEESTTRSKYPRINHFEKEDYTQYYPILHWKEWQVWEFINTFRLPYPKLYDEGFDRLGCIICPFHSEKTGQMHKLYRDRWPGYFKAYEKAIAKLYHKRVSQGKEMFYDTPQEFCDAWYLNSRARWYK